jgi:hypothetical protein
MTRIFAHLICFPLQIGLKALGGGLPILQVAALPPFPPSKYNSCFYLKQRI